MAKQEELFTECIEVKGARIHNLKNIDLSLERDKLIVITGLSGSGKSSLAFDTLYAEGQRRYVESLSAYARQFLGRLNKPEADYIKGIPPAIAVEQKTTVSNPRSTVGTSTEIYDYLKLLFARAGETYSPVSGEKVKKHSVTDVVNYLFTFPENTRAVLCAPLPPLPPGRTITEQLQIIKDQGFERIELQGKIERTEDVLPFITPEMKKDLQIVIDRITLSRSEDNRSRIADSVQTAFYESHGICLTKIYTENGIITKKFSDKFEADGIEFIPPDPHLFSFNNPIGACPLCNGFGQTIGLDPDLIIPDKTLTVYDNAVACWRGEKMSLYQKEFIKNASQCDFRIHTPYAQLSDREKDILWHGNEYCNGIYHFFKLLEKETHKIQYRVMLSRYRGKTQCPDCKGKRLRKEAEYIKIDGKSLPDLVDLPVSSLSEFFRKPVFENYKKDTTERLLEEITKRLDYLNNVGLGYLTLNRPSSTLSGGESQRINLVTSLGSSLVGSLYVLDEPSIGLHSRDTKRLIKVLKQLRDIGNTIIVVEHDEDIIKAVDYVVDIGPFSGINGGEIVFQGKLKDLSPEDKYVEKSLTLAYIQNRKRISIPEFPRIFTQRIILKGVTHHNLKMIDVEFPLNVFTVVTGVSGSGKSSLVSEVLYPALRKKCRESGIKPGNYASLEGDLSAIDAVEFVGQQNIGISSRSNPVTYVKAFDEIRKLFAQKPMAKAQRFLPSHFSFNIDGGRCDTCKGEGSLTVEMQFMADVHLPCETCEGKRFKEEILQVTHRGLSIFDILELTVEQAYTLFSEEAHTQRIADLIKPLADVGLGYIKLGQSSSTLSGGEVQRLKLASFLSKEKAKQRTVFIFDEPTTGLHFHDIKKLLAAFNALLDRGHTVIVIEHNLDVIKTADYLIDLGPEGGEEGGYLVFSGHPSEIIHCPGSYTGRFLQEKFQDTSLK